MNKRTLVAVEMIYPTRPNRDHSSHIEARACGALLDY